MTALPVPPAPLPMTAAEFAALPEDAEARFELQEGALVMPPRPVPVHQDCLFELGSQLRPQVPAHLKMLLDVDVDLQLVPPGQPGTVRAPDLVVVTRASFDRVRAEGGLLRAADVVLAVEILSTGSRRTDGVVKRGEYADAAIGHYWMVDLLGGPSLTACHLAGEFGYADAGPVTGTFASEVPFPVRIELTPLG
ncbi:MAG TPA: Uma2 family endonuclease [Pseudonocardia sp.]|nr:Uma2 family endonuclease [Pseudonocardia sp.]